MAKSVKSASSRYPAALHLEMSAMGSAVGPLGEEDLQTDAVPCTPVTAAPGEMSTMGSAVGPQGEDAIPCTPVTVAAGGDERECARQNYDIIDVAANIGRSLEGALARTDLDSQKCGDGGDSHDDLMADLRKQIPDSVQHLVGVDEASLASSSSGKGGAGPHLQESSAQPSCSDSHVASSDPSSESSEPSKPSVVEEVVSCRVIADSELPELPAELSLEFYDVLLVYSEGEGQTASHVKEHLECSQLRLKSGEKIKVLMYDSLMNICGSNFDTLELGMAHCTYIFLLLTKTFCECDFDRFKSETCLMASISDFNKKWTVVPIYTEPRRSASFRIPVGLISLKGIAYHSKDEFYYMNLKKLIEDRMYIRAEREKDWVQKKEEWKEEKRHEITMMQKIEEMKAKEKKAERERQMRDIEERMKKERELTESFNLQVLSYKGDVSPQYPDSGSSMSGSSMSGSSMSGSFSYNSQSESNMLYPQSHMLYPDGSNYYMGPQHVPGNIVPWPPQGYYPPHFLTGMYPGHAGGYPMKTPPIGPDGHMSHSASVPIFPSPRHVQQFTQLQQQQSFYAYHCVPGMPPNVPPINAQHPLANECHSTIESMPSNQPHFNLDAACSSVAISDSGVHSKLLTNLDKPERPEQMCSEAVAACKSAENSGSGSSRVKSSGGSMGIKTEMCLRGATTENPACKEVFDASLYLRQGCERNTNLPEQVEEDAIRSVDETGVKEFVYGKSRDGSPGPLTAHSKPMLDGTYPTSDQTDTKTTDNSSSHATGTSRRSLKPEHMTSNSQPRHVGDSETEGASSMAVKEIHHHHYHQTKSESAEEAKNIYIIHNSSGIHIGSTHCVTTVEKNIAEESWEAEKSLSESSDSPVKADCKYDEEIHSNSWDIQKDQTQSRLQSDIEQKQPTAGDVYLFQSNTGVVTTNPENVLALELEEREATLAKLPYNEEEEYGIMDDVQGSLMKREMPVSSGYGSLSSDKNKSSTLAECSGDHVSFPKMIIPANSGTVADSDRIAAGIKSLTLTQPSERSVDFISENSRTVRQPRITEGGALDNNKNTLTSDIPVHVSASSPVLPCSTSTETGTISVETSSCEVVRSVPAPSPSRTLESDNKIVTNFPNVEKNVADQDNDTETACESVDSERQGSLCEGSFDGTSVDPPQKSRRKDSNKNCVVS